MSDYMIGYNLYADCAGRLGDCANTEQRKGYINAMRGHNASLAYDAAGNDDASVAKLLRYPVYSGNDEIDRDICQTQAEMKRGEG